MRTGIVVFAFPCAFLCAFAFACAPRVAGPPAKSDPNLVGVCTSMYPSVIDGALGPLVDAYVAKAAPGTLVGWEMRGSEELRRSIEGELKKGPSRCDVLLIADPWFYQSLAARKKLVPYTSKFAERIPVEARDPHGAWVAARYSAMVLGVSDGSKEPLAFADLAREKRVAVSIGDPEVSGTSLVTVARLAERYGWAFYESLRDRNVVVALSDHGVLERLEKRESDVGMLLLEVLLAARAKGSTVAMVVPKDGAVVIPGPIALLRDTPRTRAVYDAILSPEVQQAIAEKGWMYAADPSLPGPAGAPPFASLLAGSRLASAFAPAEDETAVRARFAKVFARD